VLILPSLRTLDVSRCLHGHGGVNLTSLSGERLLDAR
jgi:hypothetical protein